MGRDQAELTKRIYCNSHHEALMKRLTKPNQNLTKAIKCHCDIWSKTEQLGQNWLPNTDHLAHWKSQKVPIIADIHSSMSSVTRSLSGNPEFLAWKIDGNRALETVSQSYRLAFVQFFWFIAFDEFVSGAFFLFVDNDTHHLVVCQFLLSLSLNSLSHSHVMNALHGVVCFIDPLFKAIKA